MATSSNLSRAWFLSIIPLDSRPSDNDVRPHAVVRLANPIKHTDGSYLT